MLNEDLSQSVSGPSQIPGQASRVGPDLTGTCSVPTAPQGSIAMPSGPLSLWLSLLPAAAAPSTLLVSNREAYQGLLKRNSSSRLLFSSFPITPLQFPIVLAPPHPQTQHQGPGELKWSQLRMKEEVLLFQFPANIAIGTFTGR